MFMLYVITELVCVQNDIPCQNMGLTWGEIMNNSSFYLIFPNKLELAIRFTSNLINGALKRI